MGTPLRVVHYLNQFFAGIGGEDVANIPPRMQQGPVGSGRPLQQILKDAGTVVATLICGDNFLNDARGDALAAIIPMLQDLKPDRRDRWAGLRVWTLWIGLCRGLQSCTGDRHPSVDGDASGKPWGRERQTRHFDRSHRRQSSGDAGCSRGDGPPGHQIRSQRAARTG